MASAAEQLAANFNFGVLAKATELKQRIWFTLNALIVHRHAVPFYFGGTSLPIVVSVTLETADQIHSHLLTHRYAGLVRKARLRRAGR